MGKSQTKDLMKFLKPFGKEITDKVLWLRGFVWDLYPDTNELVYDNYNAVAFGWSPTDRVGHTFCSIAIGRTSKNIHFGFYWGSEIADPEKLLVGEGNQYRYVLVRDINSFPVDYITRLMEDAYDNSMSKVKDQKMLVHGLTITKSVSPVKRTLKVKNEKLKTKNSTVPSKRGKAEAKKKVKSHKLSTKSSTLRANTGKAKVSALKGKAKREQKGRKGK